MKNIIMSFEIEGENAKVQYVIDEKKFDTMSPAWIIDEIKKYSEILFKEMYLRQINN